MKKFLKILKKTTMILGSLFLLCLMAIVLFINLSPEFGGSPSKAQKALFVKSDNYRDGKFVNQGHVELDMGLKNIGKSLLGFLRPNPRSIPDRPLPVQKVDSMDIVGGHSRTRLIWFGHSTFLLQMEQRNILIDPMFGKVPAPHPFLGTDRFSKELPIAIEQLPRIDAVLLSHDHYDHLDYGSIQKLKDKVKLFYTPLGVGAHLQKWGIAKERIVELDWWEEATFGELVFSCTPAQHFSGRGLGDRGSTLWSSWVIRSATENIFFSGDSGYGPHFKEIGEAYGPFDLALMECGQYNEMWHQIHMYPEETARAALDVGAKKVVPIHWGAFKLAMHSWNDPILRLSKSADSLGIDLLVPKIGETITLGNPQQRPTTWWH
jgi:L-ascorbate metabolism protein UlaG (beta-lactamase superfamily)